MQDKKIDKLALFGIFVAIIFGLPGVFEWFRVEPKDAVHPIIYYGVPSLIIPLTIWATVAIYRVLRELRRLQNTFEKMHEISHKFRDALHELGGRKERKDETFTQQHERDEEKRLLNDVCNHISNLFAEMTGDRCLACILLVSVRDDGFCFLDCHSLNHQSAARGIPYRIKISDHTRYQEVYNKRQTACSATLHYFSPDVTKESHYSDPYLGSDPYRSTIVVPIRCVKEPTYFLGFLKIQTAKPRRLNGQWHVELLAMVADQIFMYLNSSRKIWETAPAR